MTEPLIEIVKIDKRYNKNKSKYHVGQIISNKMSASLYRSFLVIGVRKDLTKSKKTLYTVQDTFDGIVFEDLDCQRVHELLNRVRRIHRGTIITFLEKNIPIKELERILGMKTDALVKYFNRELMSVDEIKDYIRELEAKYKLEHGLN